MSQGESHPREWSIFLTKQMSDVKGIAAFKKAGCLHILLPKCPLDQYSLGHVHSSVITARVSLYAALLPLEQILPATDTPRCYI